MGERRVYKRHLIPFRDYFKDFKKTLKKDVLMKIYQVFMYIMTEGDGACKVSKKRGRGEGLV